MSGESPATQNSNFGSDFSANVVDVALLNQAPMKSQSARPLFQSYSQLATSILQQVSQYGVSEAFSEAAVLPDASDTSRTQSRTLSRTLTPGPSSLDMGLPKAASIPHDDLCISNVPSDADVHRHGSEAVLFYTHQHSTSESARAANTLDMMCGPDPDVSFFEDVRRRFDTLDVRLLLGVGACSSPVVNSGMFGLSG